MDQSLELKAGTRGYTVERLRDFVVTSVDAALIDDAPFTHLVLDRVFPDDVYAAIVANMPTGRCTAAAEGLTLPTAPIRG
jgi:hypothetical protein